MDCYYSQHKKRKPHTRNQEQIPHKMHFHIDHDCRSCGRRLKSSSNYRKAGVTIRDNATDGKPLRRDVALEFETAGSEQSFYPALRWKGRWHCLSTVRAEKNPASCRLPALRTHRHIGLDHRQKLLPRFVHRIRRGDHKPLAENSHCNPIMVEMPCSPMRQLGAIAFTSASSQADAWGLTPTNHAVKH